MGKRRGQGVGLGCCMNFDFYKTLLDRIYELQMIFEQILKKSRPPNILL